MRKYTRERECTHAVDDLQHSRQQTTVATSSIFFTHLHSYVSRESVGPDSTVEPLKLSILAAILVLFCIQRSQKIAKRLEHSNCVD